MRFSDGAELASIPNFVYAPIFAILISPLSLLEPWLASRAWFVINLIACTAAVAAIMGALRWTPTLYRSCRSNYGSPSVDPYPASICSNCAGIGSLPTISDLTSDWTKRRHHASAARSDFPVVEQRPAS
jgi:hypothetical protein